MKKAGILILVLFFACSGTVRAEEIEQKTQEQILGQVDMSEIEAFLQDVFPNEKIDFLDTVLGLISGETDLTLELIGDMILDQFFYEFQNAKSGMIHIMLILLIAAVFHNFASVFQNSQVSELSFYVLYMLLVTICIESFRILMTSVGSGIENVLSFLQILGPIYFLVAAIATGSVTSVAFYQILLFTIYLVEMLILDLLLPLIQIYVIARILNDLSSEEILSKLTDLIQTIIVWSLRTLFAAVIGVNVIQGILSPAIDFVKRSILLKGGAALPVIGNAVEGVTEVVLGTAVLIKNGIGLAGAIVCVLLCIGPIMQMGAVILMYKAAAALAEPISDKRMIGCIGSISDGASLLLRVIVTSCALFLISIAIVASTAT